MFSSTMILYIYIMSKNSMTKKSLKFWGQILALSTLVLCGKIMIHF